MKPSNTESLPLRFRSAGAVFHTSLPREAHALRIVGILLAACVIGYIALVSMSIVNVIARKEATDQAAKLRATVGQLERDYFARSQGITVESGSSLGLSPVARTHYVLYPGAVGAADGVRNEL